jgi:hypothetical protein
MVSDEFEKDEKSGPLYFADPRFNKEIKEKIYFCGPIHGVEWTRSQQNLKK